MSFMCSVSSFLLLLSSVNLDLVPLLPLRLVVEIMALRLVVEIMGGSFERAEACAQASTVLCNSDLFDWRDCQRHGF